MLMMLALRSLTSFNHWVELLALRFPEFAHWVEVLPCCVFTGPEMGACVTEFQLMLMMLALRLLEFVQSMGRSATLLCVQRPGDGSLRLNGIPADADDARPEVLPCCVFTGPEMGACV